MTRLRVAAAVVGLGAASALGVLAPAFGGSLNGGLDFEIFVPTTPVSPGEAVDAYGVVKNLNTDHAIEGPIDAEFGAAAPPNSLSGPGWACSWPPPACTTQASIAANEALPAIALNFTVPSSGVDFNPWYRCAVPESRMCLKISGIAFAPQTTGGPSGSDEFDLPIAAAVANLDVAVAADAIEAGRPARYRFMVTNAGSGTVGGPIGILVTKGPPGLSNPSVEPTGDWSCDFSRASSELYICERAASLGGGETAPALEITWQTSSDTQDFPCEGEPCINLTAVPRADGVTGLGTTDRRPVTMPPPPPPAAPCIVVRPATPVDFGARAFSAPGAIVQAHGTPAVEVENCGSSSSQLHAHGGNASGGGTTWTLSAAADSCAAGVNVFGLSLGALALTSADQLVGALEPGATRTEFLQLTMPCAGSGGTGSTLQMQVVFTATG